MRSIFLPDDSFKNCSNKKVFFILQLFDADTRSVEISQSYVTQRESTDYSVPCKRRKIDVGWEVIKDYLQKSQSDFDLVPW